MLQSIVHIALVVNDYDEAIEFLHRKTSFYSSGRYLSGRLLFL